MSDVKYINKSISLIMFQNPKPNFYYNDIICSIIFLYKENYLRFRCIICFKIRVYHSFIFKRYFGGGGKNI